MQKARRHPISGLRPLVSVWFQVLFTLLFGVLFTFPSRYWFTIGLSVVFSLTGWCRQIQPGLLRPRPTQDTRLNQTITSTGLSPSMVGLPMPFLFSFDLLCRSYNPSLALTTLVWTLPSSLATTLGITIVFSSCRYLDVSVPCVCLPITRNTRSSIRWVSPFGHLRINGCVPLPVTFRSLPRPSSPLRA
jgi:hypothetical protein